jgi:hypothetical protein
LLTQRALWIIKKISKTFSSNITFELGTKLSLSFYQEYREATFDLIFNNDAAYLLCICPIHKPKRIEAYLAVRRDRKHPNLIFSAARES